MKKFILIFAAILLVSCGEKKEEEDIDLGNYNDPTDSTTTVDPPGSFTSDTLQVDSLSTDTVTGDSVHANSIGNRQNRREEN